MNGIGMMRYQVGDVYTGKWHDDQRHGVGTMIYMNNDVYDGHWKYGEKHGRGMMKYGDGRIEQGNWINDKFSLDDSKAEFDASDDDEDGGDVYGDGDSDF